MDNSTKRSRPKRRFQQGVYDWNFLVLFDTKYEKVSNQQFNIAKLTWAKSVTYWYEYKLNEEELKAYQKDGTTPETFFDDGEVVGEEENHWDVEVNLVLEEGDEQ